MARAARGIESVIYVVDYFQGYLTSMDGRNERPGQHKEFRLGMHVIS